MKIKAGLIAALLVFAAVACIHLSSADDRTGPSGEGLLVSVVKAEDSALLPKNIRQGAKDFIEAYKSEFDDRKKKWLKERKAATQNTIQFLPYVYSTETSKGEYVRAYYFLDEIGKKDLIFREGGFIAGWGLTQNPKAKSLKWKEIDSFSTESIVDNIYEITSRSKNKSILPLFSCFLYYNDQEWAGNRIMRRYADMERSNRELHEAIIEFVRKAHKWPEDAEIVEVQFGDSSGAMFKRQEFALKDKEAPKEGEEGKAEEKEEPKEGVYSDYASDRKRCWEDWCKRELAFWTQDVRRTAAVTEAITWKHIDKKAPDPELGMWNWEILVKQGEEIAKHVSSSQALRTHIDESTKLTELTKDEKVARKNRKEIAELTERNYFHWMEFAKKRKKEIDDAIRLALQKYKEADAKYEKDSTTGSRDSFPIFDEAEEAIAKLINFSDNKKQKGALAPNNGFAYFHAAKILTRTCRPRQRSVDKAEKESKVTSAIECCEIALRYFPEHQGIRHMKARSHLLKQQYKQAREIWEAIVEEGGPQKKSAEKWLENLQRAEQNNANRRKARERGQG